jgi:hypothetical protein
MTESLNFDGVDWTLTEDSMLKWTTAWLTCATIPDSGITVSAQSIDFGDVPKDNALWWERTTWILSSSGGGVELSYGYVTAVAGDATYDDIDLGSIPASADFLRIKAKLTRTTSPTAPTPANMMTGALDPIVPVDQYFMAHDNFVPLEQAFPIARAVRFLNDAGTLKLQRLQSISADNLVDDMISGWAPGNSQSAYATTTTLHPVSGGTVTVHTAPATLTYGTQKGEPIYYLGTAGSPNDGSSGSEGTALQTDYARDGSKQIDLTDTTNFQSVYSLDAVIEPGYFKTDAVLGTPTEKSVLRAAYGYRATADLPTTVRDTLAYSGIHIGTPASSRLVLVMAFSGNAGTGGAAFHADVTALTLTYKDASGTTLGTVAATKLASADALAWTSVSIWIAAVPDGEVVDLAGPYENANSTVDDAVLVYSLYNFDSATAVATISGDQNGTEGTNLTKTLTTSAGGFAFVAGNHLDAGDGSYGNLLGGISNPGFHPIAGHFSAPYCFEGAMQGTDGTSLSLVMAGQTGRHTALAGVSLS